RRVLAHVEADQVREIDRAVPDVVRARRTRTGEAVAPDLKLRRESAAAALDVPRGEHARERLASIASVRKAVIKRGRQVRYGIRSRRAALGDRADVDHGLALREVL